MSAEEVNLRKSVADQRETPLPAGEGEMKVGKSGMGKKGNNVGEHAERLVGAGVLFILWTGREGFCLVH